jgi:hypothetical protein
MLSMFTKFDASAWPRIIAPLLAGLTLAAAYQNNSQAAPAARPSYVISEHDGYGVIECLTQKKDCGKIVADSWCEAHGHGPAAAYGRADDITASIETQSPTAPRGSGDAIITCSE